MPDSPPHPSRSDTALLASSVIAGPDVPGAFETVIEREIPGGLVRFEFAPKGYLTAKGERRRADWRAYWFTGTDGKRRRMTSVTTVLSQIMPADGLVPWAEAAGIRGAVEAIRRGFLDPEYPDMAVGAVRANRLGADAARDQAASRGTDIHALLEDFAREGKVPNPGEFPVEQHGYIRSLSRWLLATNLEPEVIEQIVCSPDDGFAGRLDLIGRSEGQRVLWDLKTSAKGQVYPKAHLQLGLLERAMRFCGDGEVDARRIVALAEDGSFREVEGMASSELIDAAVRYADLLRPVTSACESRNRVVREALKAAA